MTGTYVLPAIPPYCAEVRERAEVVEWRGNRVLLRVLEPGLGLIETDLGSFVPDIPPNGEKAV